MKRWLLLPFPLLAALSIAASTRACTASCSASKATVPPKPPPEPANCLSQKNSKPPFLPATQTAFFCCFSSCARPRTPRAAPRLALVAGHRRRPRPQPLRPAEEPSQPTEKAFWPAGNLFWSPGNRLLLATNPLWPVENRLSPPPNPLRPAGNPLHFGTDRIQFGGVSLCPPAPLRPPLNESVISPVSIFNSPELVTVLNR